MAIQTEKPIECVGCNTFDMKSLFDNSDCSFPIEQFYATRQDAEGALEYVTLKARDVPCNSMGSPMGANFTTVTSAPGIIPISRKC